MTDFYPDADRPAVLLIAAMPDREALTGAIAAARGRVAGPIGWDAVGALDDLPTTIVAAAQGVPDALLADGLDRLAAAAARDDVAIVVTLDEAQIDLVANALLDSRAAQLLCSPDAAMLAAALALALARRRDLLADTVREDEADRLRRLNEEVARIAEVLARLTTAADRRVDTVTDRTTGYGAPPSSVAVTAADIRAAIRARRLRDVHFGSGMFEDPAWDMLLDLYAAELESSQVSVSSLCIAAAVAPTTALRWIGRMTDAGLFVRRPDPFDRRRAFMVLSDGAREKMQRYFAALAGQRLAIG